MKKHSLLTTLVFFLGISFGTFAQSKDELKLKSFFNEGKFDKCDQLCEKLEKKSKGDALATVHLYSALSNLGMANDEFYTNSGLKKPIRIVSVRIGKYQKIASDSARVNNAELEGTVLRALHNVIVNKLEVKQYSDAKYLADKLSAYDSTNVGAALVLDFINLIDGGKAENRFDAFYLKGQEVLPRQKMFFVDVAVIYAAWLTKEGKSDSAADLANKVVGLVGDNELLEIFR